MLWFTVWAVLVVGTLVGAFFVLRRLYRSGRDLVRELDRAAQVLGEVSERAEELMALADERAAIAPVDLTDPGPARERRAQAAVATARRRAARAERQAETRRRWRSFSR